METYIPLQQKAYDYIRKLIHDGSLEKGKYYSEKKIAADMNISRTPVRDAILRLSQDRYIDIVPSKGFRLHTMTEKDIWDAFEVRTAIEGFCGVELHARRNTEEGKEAIRQIGHDLADMYDAMREPDSDDKILNYDFSFHRKIVGAGKNQDFIKLFESYYHMLYDIADMSFIDPKRPMKAYEEHKEIYDAIISDDPDAEVKLYKSTMAHMVASRDIALRKLKTE